MGTGAFSSTVRCVASDNNSEFPFVSIYVMPDIAFASSDSFRSLIGLDHPADKEHMPDSAKISDLIEADIRIYSRVSECHEDGKISGAVRSLTLIEGEAREARSEAESKKEFEEKFLPFIKTLQTNVHRERYVLEDEWWSAGGSLYNRDHLDIYGFDEEKPDHSVHFAKLLAHPNAPRLEDFSFEVKTFTVIRNVSADESR
ncbi:hypothetical protein MN608_01875 [Microdochium nivale]|nr:hypothetical protein MN608_01875 [Microdochium nivale]